MQISPAARAAAKPDWWYFPGRGWSVWLQFPHELTGPHRDPMRWASPSARADYARRKAERMLDLVERPPFVGGVPAEYVHDMDGWFVQLGL